MRRESREGEVRKERKDWEKQRNRLYSTSVLPVPASCQTLDTFGPEEVGGGNHSQPGIQGCSLEHRVLFNERAAYCTVSANCSELRAIRGGQRPGKGCRACGAKGEEGTV